MGQIVSIESLPTGLRAYARGEPVEIDKTDWPAALVLQARWHRKAFFRRLQREQPGRPYLYADFNLLMRDEIIRHARLRLYDFVYENWFSLLDSQPRLKAYYNAEYDRGMRRIPKTDQAQKRLHVLREAMRTAFHQAVTDPIALGMLEQTTLGKIEYGMPDTNNHDPCQRDDS